jgi:hypothetical protein
MYTGLSLNKSTEIRLLTLLPANNSDDPIECLISRADLDAAPVYKAVSYCWGRRENPIIITVGDIAFEVTENLGTALRYIRDSWAPTMLWIDAVCINQNDDSEKETQIPLMRRIYGSAEATICWIITNPTPNSLLQIGFYLAFLSNPEAIPLEQRNAILGLNGSFAQAEHNLGVKGAITQSVEAMVAAVLLMVEAFDYWHRTWIVQEILLSKKPILQGALLGTKAGNCLPWDVLQSRILQNGDSDPGNLSIDHITTTFTVGGDTYAFTSAPPRKIKRLVEMRDAWQSGRPKSRDMLSIMVANAQKQSTDPRDKIWGFFGISEDAQQLTSVDLTISVTDLYIRWACAFITKHKSLRVLQHAGIGQSSRPTHMAQAHQAPSWVPRWDLADKDKTASESHKYSLDHHGVLFGASGGREPEVSLSVDRNVLSARGILVDIVDGIQEDQDEKAEDGAYLSMPSTCLAWLVNKLGIDAFRRPSHAGTRQTVFESFFRTLMTDRLPCQNRRLQHGAEYYYLLLSFVLGVITSTIDDRFGDFRFREDGTCFLKCKAVHQELVVIEGDSYTIEDQKLLHARSAISSTDRVALYGTVTGYFMLGRVFFLTQGGYMGLGPAGMLANDRICVLYGCSVPLVLRKVESHWVLVGECYVHGLMDGLVMDMLASGELEDSTFEIW